MIPLDSQVSHDDLDALEVRYHFIFPDGRFKVFRLDLAEGFVLRERRLKRPLPAWVALGFHQCPNCPLSTKEVPHCPLSVGLVELIESSVNLRSYDEVRVEVHMKSRTVIFNAAMQKALSSLMGLIIPLSGCPHTAPFKPMARFHLPHATVEETIYRVTSMYLLSQYLRHVDGKDAVFDLSGLREIYQHVHVVNRFVSERIRAIVEEDASVNAVIILDMFSQVLPMSLEQTLEELKPLFHATLER
ncbi:DUF6901 family protein [Acanthopleuribacter pedis]|uniref:Uncharacterized protein n=1 Tax=Acanthopleuribacter pedis TaxID=442870 RepID=A0A8J7U866_9BACT|nr:hypothetical protein [Acanthopleuribacter pedis]MBO1322176.1 hypothetical protein [Acanthopleuribacter pedis]